MLPRAQRGVNIARARRSVAALRRLSSLAARPPAAGTAGEAGAAAACRAAARHGERRPLGDRCADGPRLAGAADRARGRRRAAAGRVAAGVRRLRARAAPGRDGRCRALRTVGRRGAATRVRRASAGHPGGRSPARVRLARCPGRPSWSDWRRTAARCRKPRRTSAVAATRCSGSGFASRPRAGAAPRFSACLHHAADRWSRGPRFAGACDSRPQTRKPRASRPRASEPRPRCLPRHPAAHTASDAAPNRRADGQQAERQHAVAARLGNRRDLQADVQVVGLGPNAPGEFVLEPLDLDRVGRR